MSYAGKDHGMHFKDSATLDAFGRVRVSEPFTLFSSQLTYDRDLDRWFEITALGGTITHLPNESSVQMQVSTANGSKCVRQSKESIRYQPGKSQQIFITGSLGVLKPNVTQRLGYFDDNNGLFFEQDGSYIKTVVRSYTTGSVVDTAINQSSWNIDLLNGTGPSGVTLDPTKEQIFIIDFGWFGSNRVRFGVVINGVIIYCHEVYTANVQSIVYMTTANLPIRYEIFNVGTTASSTIMKQTCSSVVSEGGYNERGYLRTASNGVTARSVTTSAFLPLVSLRIGSSYPAAQIVPLSVEMLCTTTGADIIYQLVKNGTLTLPSWTAGSQATEIDVTATAISGGTVVYSGYATGAGAGVTANFAFSQEDFEKFTYSNGSSDTLSLVARAIGSNGSMYGSINYKELR